jgi:excisionase family DNA binding protein
MTPQRASGFADDLPQTAARAHAREALALTIELSPEQIDAVAERVAARLQPAPGADGWLRGAGRIAAYIDCPRSRIYALTSAGRIPVGRDGSNLIARRSDLDRWLREGGGRRP